MEILFTGASSFTGMWFVKELVAAGHTVTAVFLRPEQEYSGVRLERIQQLLPICRCVFDVKFGSEKFLEVIHSQSHWDILCHHAADVTDYKSMQFDAVKALESNTYNLSSVLEALKRHGNAKIVLTGSVFEQREGIGTLPLRAFSPYGLSKGLTYDVFAYYAAVHETSLSKFVIPNPFGPYEEPRFTAYLMETWLKGGVAEVKTPLYVRDNVPVTLMAKAYSAFVKKVAETDANHSYGPSYYAEPQVAFSQRVAEAMRARLQMPCELALFTQTSFQEPLERVNIHRVDSAALGWDEEAAWDDFAAYYLRRHAPKEARL